MTTDLMELLAKHRAELAAEYAEKSPAICEQYGLDAEKNECMVRSLINAHNRLAICAGCNGDVPNCRQVQPVIEVHGKQITIYDVECKWGYRDRMLRFARKFVPKRYAFKGFDDYEVTVENRRAIGMGHWFLQKGDGHSLYYHGGYGTGKTFLVSLIAKELVIKGKKIEFGNVPALLDEIKRTFNDPTVSAQQVLKRYLDCDVLIMDDIGTEKVSDWSVVTLYQIIDGRYNAELPIIFTSNLTPEELQARYAEKDKLNAGRIGSRLAQMCYVGSLGNRDRRKSC